MTRDARLVHGVQLHRTGRLNEAAELYKELLLEFPLDTLVLNNLATAMFQLGNIAEGLPLVQQSLEIDPDQPLAEYNKGKALLALNRTTEAMASFESAIRLKPDLTDAHNDKGLVLQSMGRHSEAIECFDRALALNESFTALNNRGCSLRALGKLQEGLADVDRAAQLQPAVPEIHKNRGDILRELSQFESAIECYDLAIHLRPNYSEAYNNKGLVLKELHRLDEALEAYDRAIGSNHNAEASFNRGWILEQQKKYAESLASYQRAVAEKPDIDYGLGNILAQKMRIFDWQGVNELRAEIVTRIGSGLRSAPPFIVLAFSDSLEIQRQAAKIWIDDRDPLLGENQPLPPFQDSTERKQLTIGYFSADFRMHPVSYLTAGLYEHHDRSRFRIYAFSSGPNTGDPLSQRVRRAFDHFIDIRGMSDLEVVNLARAAKIDIAVDLGGLTQDCRTGIFARRAAPIQVNYLGYPGTLGATFMDYILGDKFLIPDAVRDCYSEKVVQLPVFQANDDRRSISSRVFSKRELRIPDESFAFCCLNNSLKITHEVFSSWMTILSAVPGATLALLADSVATENRLGNEARQRGIDPKRLIFVGRADYEDYLSRYRVFDLFLDTFPFNAGTTASDALWAGLPVLTRAGESYASRMAGSLLHALDLPELVTQTPTGYEAAAIRLATQPQQLRATRERLAAARSSSLLFNTAAFTRSLENAYAAMHQSWIEGSAPEHLTVT